MKPNKIIIFSLIVFAFISCQKENIQPIDMPEGLHAIWIENGYDKETSIFKKSNEFDTDKYGFHIMDDGIFLERKNASFCGTPPIVYENYEGTWSMLSDSIINVESTYWGGTMIFKMEIISMNENELRVRYKYENN